MQSQNYILALIDKCLSTFPQETEIQLLPPKSTITHFALLLDPDVVPPCPLPYLIQQNVPKSCRPIASTYCVQSLHSLHSVESHGLWEPLLADWADHDQSERFAVEVTTTRNSSLIAASLRCLSSPMKHRTGAATLNRTFASIPHYPVAPVGQCVAKGPSLLGAHASWDHSLRQGGALLLQLPGEPRRQREELRAHLMSFGRSATILPHGQGSSADPKARRDWI